MTRKGLEVFYNGFFLFVVTHINRLVCPFSSFWPAPRSYPCYTPKKETSALQGAKGFLLSPKIPSLLSMGAEGDQCVPGRAQKSFAPCLLFVMLPTEPQGEHMALLH